MYTFHDDFVEEQKIALSVTNNLYYLQEDNSVPSERIILPFYYLHLIGNSIKKGEYITPKLFAPKSMWTQDCKELNSITKKCVVFRFLSDILQKYVVLIQKNTIQTAVFKFVFFNQNTDELLDAIKFIISAELGEGEKIEESLGNKFKDSYKKSKDKIGEGTQSIENYSKLIFEFAEKSAPFGILNLISYRKMDH